MDIITPKRINRKIKFLLGQINTNHDPVWVPVQTESYAKIEECIPNVKQKIKIDNGDIIYGWQISQTPSITEAIFHSVWQSPSGNLIDITPKPFPMNTILFVQDNTISYNGQQIDNIRINNTSNELVDDLILYCRLIFKILNKGERAKMMQVNFNLYEARLYEFLQKNKVNLEFYIINGAELNSPCFCDSGKEYYKCHREELFKINGMI